MLLKTCGNVFVQCAVGLFVCCFCLEVEEGGGRGLQNYGEMWTGNPVSADTTVAISGKHSSEESTGRKGLYLRGENRAQCSALRCHNCDDCHARRFDVSSFLFSLASSCYAFFGNTEHSAVWFGFAFLLFHQAVAHTDSFFAVFIYCSILRCLRFSVIQCSVMQYGSENSELRRSPRHESS